MKNLLGFGNNKLPKTTAIFNMGTANDCPSKRLGFCKVGNKCYALKAERLYKAVTPFRERQGEYWTKSTALDICQDMSGVLNRKRVKTKLFRFNESGDFNNQADVDKLNTIAKYLKKHHNIITYGYTARKDLNFKGVSFLVKGSGNDNGNNGETMVLKKGDSLPSNFTLCSGSCKTCNICAKKSGVNIAFLAH